jgi:SAM-dependent methyltransferase
MGILSLDRKEHWDTAHSTRRARELSWYEQNPALSLSMIGRANIAADTPILDVGGGASSLVDFLLEDGYRDLTVLDVSGVALRKARRRLGDKASRVGWIEQDITSFEAGRKYGLWHDRALFHFLTLKVERRKYIQALRKALQGGGQAIISSFAIGGPERCSGLDIVQYDAAKLGRELGTEFTLLEQEQVLHLTPANKEQLFGFYRFIRD